MPPPAACSEFIPFGENKFLVMGTLRAWSTGLVWSRMAWHAWKQHVNRNTTSSSKLAKALLLCGLFRDYGYGHSTIGSKIARVRPCRLKTYADSSYILDPSRRLWSSCYSRFWLEVVSKAALSFFAVASVAQIMHFIVQAINPKSY
jgi:hypothetical protein